MDIKPFDGNEIEEWVDVAKRLGLGVGAIKGCRLAGYSMTQTLLLLHKDSELIRFVCGMSRKEYLKDLIFLIEDQEKRLEEFTTQASWQYGQASWMVKSSEVSLQVVRGCQHLLDKLRAPISLESFSKDSSKAGENGVDNLKSVMNSNSERSKQDVSKE